MMVDAELDARIAEAMPDVIELRRALHQMPEIAGHEHKTSARIRDALAPLGLDVRKPYLQTDVVALLNRGKGRNLTLRAELDALPLEETGTPPWRSTHPGMMHACGHDGHAAMLYGAARVLSGMRDRVRRSVRFLFQPGEEIVAMGKDLLDAGALRDPAPDFIAGLHNWPGKPYGKICTKPGILLAAAGSFTIKLHGRGGHGAMPKLAINPIDCAAEIIDACNKLPGDGRVLTFCACTAGADSSNVIPDSAELRGTVRFLDPDGGRRLVADFEATARQIAARRSVRCEFACPTPYPPLVNRAEDYREVRDLVTTHLGEDAFHELSEHMMSSEDFSWFLQSHRGVFSFLGAGDSPPLHSGGYDFDDRLLETGIRYFALLALHQ
ncbi:MAG: M20 metallopeptidase family protein [Kiritimatiellia bacterium]|jgi:hippurate hydrolase